MKTYTEDQVIDSLFKKGGTLANTGIEVKKHRKNAKEVYFTYKGKEYCITKGNIVAKFSDHNGKRYFQYASLDFSVNKYEEIRDSVMKHLGRI